MAEESGLIARVGEWALRRACRQVAAWRADGLPIGLSVSCTARQACGPGFVRAVIAALDEAELPPQQLTLEVTERVLSEGRRPLRRSGRPARQGNPAGSRLLRHRARLARLLRRSAVDVVKIDSSYVTGLETDPTLALLTKSIIGLAIELGIEVIAEGCHPAARAGLLDMGCGLGQGPGAEPPLRAGDHEAESAGAAGDHGPKSAGAAGDHEPEDSGAGDPVPSSIVAPTRPSGQGTPPAARRAGR